MRRVAWLVAGVTLVAAAAYTVVSLARWEWNRALFFTILFVAVEVGLATAFVLRRLARVERLVVHASTSDGGARRALRETRGEHVRFAWLRVDPTDVVGRTNVFVTFLVGGGLLISAGAWLIDKVASNTVDPRLEQRLGRELDAIAYRPGLLVHEVDALARPALDRDDPRVRSFLGPDR